MPQNHKNLLEEDCWTSFSHLLCFSHSLPFFLFGSSSGGHSTVRTAELHHSSHTACQVPSCMESLSKDAEPHPASSSAATRSLPANKMLPTSSEGGTKPCHSGWHTRDPEEALQWQWLHWRQSLLFTGQTTCWPHSWGRHGYPGLQVLLHEVMTAAAAILCLGCVLWHPRKRMSRKWWAGTFGWVVTNRIKRVFRRGSTEAKAKVHQTKEEGKTKVALELEQETWTLRWVIFENSEVWQQEELSVPAAATDLKNMVMTLAAMRG